MSKVFNMVGGGGGGIKLDAISIQTPPTKTTYTAGELFNPAGMEVKATYTNGATMLVGGYTYSPTELTDGTTQVTIQYSEGGVSKTAVQAVTVVHRLASIAVTAQPTKTVYEYGDTFDPAGMTVRATYSDGTAGNVTGYSCSPSALSTVGTQTVTVSYTERSVTKTTTLSVTVERKKISTLPTQSGSLTYNGSSQTPAWSGYDSEKMTLSGTTSATNAGTYGAKFTPTANYRWSDGTTGAKTVNWTISKAAGSLSISPTSMTLDMNTQSGTISVTRAGDGAISAVSSNTSAVTVSVSGTTVTAHGVANGSATITVSVAAGTNHNAPANKTCEVTVSFLDDNFANNTWEAIIAACQSGSVPTAWAVGNYKNMTIGGAEYRVDIIGKSHDTYSTGGTKAPLTFQLHDCYADTKNMNSTNTNAGGWKNCAMRTTHLPSILNSMPTAVKNAIREVNKLSSAGSQSSNIDTTADKLFLLSEIEIFGSATYSKSGEGSQYAYYTAGNTKVKNRAGSATAWWERSPYGSNSARFCFVTGIGGANSSGASYSLGVAFGFCF